MFWATTPLSASSRIRRRRGGSLIVIDSRQWCISGVVSPRFARDLLKHPAGQHSLMFVVVENHLTADDSAGETLGALDDADLAAREIIRPLLRAQPDRFGIEQNHVGVEAGNDPSLVREAEKRGRLRSQSLNGALERKHVPLFHPFMQQIRRDSGVAQLVDMRTRVRQPDHYVRQLNRLGQQIEVGVASGEEEPGLEVLLYSEVEDRVHRILVNHRGHLGDGFIKEALILPLLGTCDLDGFPSAAENRSAPRRKVLAESLTEVRVSVERDLLLGAAIERRPP